MLIVGGQLYAYAKVAQGEDIEKAPKPGMMDFTVRLSHPLRSLSQNSSSLPAPRQLARFQRKERGSVKRRRESTG